MNLAEAQDGRQRVVRARAPRAAGTEPRGNSPWAQSVPPAAAKCQCTMHAKARLVPGAPRAARHPAPALTATNASQGAATPRPPKTVILRARASGCRTRRCTSLLLTSRFPDPAGGRVGHDLRTGSSRICENVQCIKFTTSAATFRLHCLGPSALHAADPLPRASGGRAGGPQCSERAPDRGKGLERSRRGGHEPLRIPIAAAFSPCQHQEE